VLPGMFEYRIVTSGPGAWGGGGRVGAGRIPWDFRGSRSLGTERRRPESSAQSPHRPSKRTNTEPPAECRATRPGAGKSPSVASLYRALAEVEQAAADDGLPIRPKQVRIRRPDDPLTPEEMNLRERLQAQVLQRSEDE
jgi:hypothetical protein